jgi:hypothetical protein
MAAAIAGARERRPMRRFWRSLRKNSNHGPAELGMRDLRGENAMTRSFALSRPGAIGVYGGHIGYITPAGKSTANSPTIEASGIFRKFWWAHKDSNLGPAGCAQRIDDLAGSSQITRT